MNGLLQALRNLRGRHQGAAQAAPRRAEPRISKCLSVHLADLTLTSTNVTAAGLQLMCPGQHLSGLRARWEPEAIPVAIELPDGQRIAAQCSVRYVSESEDDFLIGLTFVHMDPAAEGPWQTYIAKLEASALGGGA